jgi:hypothetical protein
MPVQQSGVRAGLQAAAERGVIAASGATGSQRIGSGGPSTR